MSGGHKHVGLRNVAHNPLALAMAKTGRKSSNQVLKPVPLDKNGQKLKKAEQK
jgi:hypothetical protein